MREPNEFWWVRTRYDGGGKLGDLGPPQVAEVQIVDGKPVGVMLTGTDDFLSECELGGVTFLERVPAPVVSGDNEIAIAMNAIRKAGDDLLKHGRWLAMVYENRGELLKEDQGPPFPLGMPFADIVERATNIAFNKPAFTALFDAIEAATKLAAAREREISAIEMLEEMASRWKAAASYPRPSDGQGSFSDERA